MEIRPEDRQYIKLNDNESSPSPSPKVKEAMSIGTKMEIVMNNIKDILSSALQASA